MTEDRVREFEEVLALDPEDATVRFGLSQALMDAGRPGEAVPHLREALRVKPDYSMCHHLLGQCLEATKDVEEAQKAYRQGMETAKGLGDLHVVHLIEERLKAIGESS